MTTRSLGGAGEAGKATRRHRVPPLVWWWLAWAGTVAAFTTCVFFDQ